MLTGHTLPGVLSWPVSFKRKSRAQENRSRVPIILRRRGKRPLHIYYTVSIQRIDCIASSCFGLSHALRVAQQGPHTERRPHPPPSTHRPPGHRQPEAAPFSTSPSTRSPLSRPAQRHTSAYLKLPSPHARTKHQASCSSPAADIFRPPTSLF